MDQASESSPTSDGSQTFRKDNEQNNHDNASADTQPRASLETENNPVSPAQVVPPDPRLYSWDLRPPPLATQQNTQTRRVEQRPLAQEGRDQNVRQSPQYFITNNSHILINGTPVGRLQLFGGGNLEIDPSSVLLVTVENNPPQLAVSVPPNIRRNTNTTTPSTVTPRTLQSIFTSASLINTRTNVHHGIRANPALLCRSSLLVRPSRTPRTITASESSPEPGLTDNHGTRKRKATSSDEGESAKRKKTVKPDAPAIAPKSAEHYAHGIEEPSGMTKPEEGRCLTCLRQGRSCRGTQLVMVEGRKRCPACANGDKDGKGKRVCYWKDEARGVRTYEDAQRLLADDMGGRVLEPNTRAGRRVRQQQATASTSANTPTSTSTSDNAAASSSPATPTITSFSRTLLTNLPVLPADTSSQPAATTDQQDDTIEASAATTGTSNHGTVHGAIATDAEISQNDEVGVSMHSIQQRIGTFSTARIRRFRARPRRPDPAPEPATEDKIKRIHDGNEGDDEKE